jgi:hypothetical protein
MAHDHAADRALASRYTLRGDGERNTTASTHSARKPVLDASRKSLARLDQRIDAYKRLHARCNKDDANAFLPLCRQARG